MFLLSARVCEQLLAQVRETAPLMACGLLLGKQQGGIIQIIPLENCAHNPSSDWQLNPQQLTDQLAQLMRQGSIVQGIYYTHGGEHPMPTRAMIGCWHYNVPCFVVSHDRAKSIQVHAFSIDPVLHKVEEVPLWFEPAQEQPEQERPQLEQSKEVSTQEDIVLGEEVQTAGQVVLTPRVRGLSTYVIGAMGMGKTTLLLNIILSDIERGDGVCVLDPHGDLTHDILCRTPPHRKEDVIVWEPFDTEYPFGLNLFACADVTDANLVDQICSQAIGTFYKLFHESWGPQMEDLLRVTFLTLIYNQDLPVAQRPTLVEIPRLLTDPTYRAFLVGRIDNAAVREFWHYTYNPLKLYDQIEYHRSSLNKVRRFLLNRTIRNIVGQAENSLDLRLIMDADKVLLVNLSKGRLGEDNSGLLGSLLIGKLLTAALSRADLPFEQRQPFHLVVDEYQNFATQTFTTLQTEARKFGIDTIVAHQTRAMLDEASKGATSAVGNLICFAVTGADAQELAIMFNNEPPEPPIAGVQPIRTYSASPWAHLTRHGHRDPTINELVTKLKAALIPLPKRELPAPNGIGLNDGFYTVLRKLSGDRLPVSDVRRFIVEEDVRRFEDILNTYLYHRMKGLPESAMLTDLKQLKELGPFYTTLKYYGEPGYLVVNVGKLNNEFLIKEAVNICSRINRNGKANFIATSNPLRSFCRRNRSGRRAASLRRFAINPASIVMWPPRLPTR
jgi:proteasome lid subunit RPN8/RPN11